MTEPTTPAGPDGDEDFFDTIHRLSTPVPATGDVPAELPEEGPAVPRVPSAPQRRVLTWRRGVVGALGLTLLGTGIGYVLKPLPGSKMDNWMARTGLTLSERSAKLRELQSAFAAQKEAFARATAETGRIDPVALNALVQTAEWISYLQDVPSQEVQPPEEFAQRHYGSFRDSVSVAVKVGDQMEGLAKAEPSLAPLVRIKLAMDAILGDDVKYNKENSAMPDVVMNKRLQCQSGTRTFIALAMDLARVEIEQSGGTLVHIYTEGHVLPGLLTAQNKLYGIEMTAKGVSVCQFGVLGSITVPMVVAIADRELAESAGGVTLPGKTVVLDTSPMEKTGGSWFAGQRGLSSKNAFGTAKVAAGDQAMTTNDVVVPSMYRGGAPMEKGDAAADLNKLPLTLDERKVIDAYAIDAAFFMRLYNRHATIVNRVQENPAMSADEFQKQIDEIIVISKDLLAYIDQNPQVMDTFTRANAILRRYGKAATMDPREVGRVIGHNGLVLIDQRSKK